MNEEIINLYSLEGKSIVVTGAGEGIGKATAIHLAKCGAKVIALSNQKGEIDLLKKECRQFKISSFVCDVSNSEQMNKIFSKIGKIDGFVNNAAIFCHISPLDVKKEDWDKILQNNAYSVFLCSQLVVRNFLKYKTPGCIVNVSSLKFLRGQGYDTPYAVSKAAIDTITRDFAVFFGKYGIRVNSVLPGSIRTPNNLKHLKDFKNGKKMLLEFENRVPLKRGGNANEVAYLIHFLLSDASSYLNGASVVIDGGYSVVLQ